MDITSLQSAYRAGTLTPATLIEQIYSDIEQQGERPVWITLVPKEHSLARAAELDANEAAHKLPLFGVPFAVKDNFDVAGLPTTAACPAFAHEATGTATVIQRLLDAGAILIGKTNMDQFATGLVGTRSPYGICSSVFDPEYISGGSSSGSAVAVARGLVSFSLGTDTAGSGRVPAAFNQLVGLKPSRGWISTHGLLPACRTLDCVSIFAETCADAARVFKQRAASMQPMHTLAFRWPDKALLHGPRPAHAASAFRFGVPTAETKACNSSATMPRRKDSTPRSRHSRRLAENRRVSITSRSAKPQACCTAVHGSRKGSPR